MDIKERFRDILKAKVPLYHQSCGGVAFYYARVPSNHEPINNGLITLVDGTKPDSMSLMHCGSCGRPFLIMDVTLERP